MTSHSVHRRRPFCGWSVRWQASRPHPGSAGRRASSARPSTVHTLSPSCAACTGTCHGQHLVPLIPLVLTWPWCLAPPTSAGECVCLTGQSSRTWLFRRARCARPSFIRRMIRQGCSTCPPARQLPLLGKCVQRRALTAACRHPHPLPGAHGLPLARMLVHCLTPRAAGTQQQTVLSLATFAKHAVCRAQRWAGASATWWTRRR